MNSEIVISKIQEIKQKIVSKVLNKSNDIQKGSIVKVSKVEKSFGNKKILKDVSFECKSGESVIILGESGMGKSVLLRTISGFLDADSGSIKIDDTEMVNISEIKKEKIMQKIGFLFQYSGLFDHLSVWENIMFYELFIQHKDKEEMRGFALKLIEELDIPKRAIDLKPAEISGGMQRRVALARTIVKKPSLILLDEPTTGLDPVVCETINNLINKTKKQTKATMITITHDLNSALQIGDKIIVLRDGKITWSGKPDKIFDVKDKYIQSYIKATNIKK